MDLTQKHIDVLIDRLYEQVRKERFDLVVGIANSGLHVSIPLAMKLRVPHKAVRISWYEGKEKREEPIVSGYLPVNKKLLVVDDLIDTGATFETFEKTFGKHKTAVLLWMPGRFWPHYYAAIKPNEWVNFPWDKK